MTGPSSHAAASWLGQLCPGSMYRIRAWSSRVRPSPWELYITHEQRLARTLRKVGPFVAVGDPTEELPLLGAARVYAADEAWQMTLADTIEVLAR